MTGSHLAFLDGTPILAIAIDDAITRDSDVRSSFSIDGRLETTGVQAFKGGLDNGIERLVGSKENDGTGFEMQFDIAFEHDRSRVPHALWDHEFATTLLAQCINSLGKCLGIESDTIAHSAKVGQFYLIVGNNGSLHFRHTERKFLCVLLVRVVCLCAKTDCQGCNES